MILNHKNELNQVILQEKSTLGRILGLDVGSKRIGVALSDELRFIASPKMVLHRKSNKDDFLKIQEFIKEYKILAIIIGLPLNMDDSESEMSKFVRNFTDNLDDFFDKKIPILLVDERLSSFEARRYGSSKLSRKNQHCDDIAAAVILQACLDSD